MVIHSAKSLRVAFGILPRSVRSKLSIGQQFLDAFPDKAEHKDALLALAKEAYDDDYPSDEELLAEVYVDMRGAFSAMGINAADLEAFLEAENPEVIHRFHVALAHPAVFEASALARLLDTPEVAPLVLDNPATDWEPLAAVAAAGTRPFTAAHHMALVEAVARTLQEAGVPVVNLEASMLEQEAPWASRSGLADSMYPEVMKAPTKRVFRGLWVKPELVAIRASTVAAGGDKEADAAHPHLLRMHNRYVEKAAAKKHARVIRRIGEPVPLATEEELRVVLQRAARDCGDIAGGRTAEELYNLVKGHLEVSPALGAISGSQEGFREWLRASRMPTLSPGRFVPTFHADGIPWGSHTDDVLQHYTDASILMRILECKCMKTATQVFGEVRREGRDAPFYSRAVYFTPKREVVAAEHAAAIFARNSPSENAVLLYFRPALYLEQPLRFGNMIQNYGPRATRTRATCSRMGLNYLSPGLRENPVFLEEAGPIQADACLRDESDFLAVVGGGCDAEGPELGVVILDEVALPLEGFLLACVASKTAFKDREADEAEVRAALAAMGADLLITSP